MATQLTLPSSQTFPPEIVDFIIGECRDSWRTLAACSLVCRAWLPASRHGLFSSIKIGAKSISHLETLLSSPNSLLAPFVQQLILLQLDPRYFQEEMSWFWSKFVFVRALRLVHWPTSGSWKPHVALLASALPSIKRVELAFSSCWDFKMIADTIGTFPSVQIVGIQGNWNVRTIPIIEECPPPTHLTSLELACWSEDVLSWVSHAPSPPPIQSLTLRCIKSTEHLAISAFLKLVSPTLQRLSLEFVDEPTIRRIAPVSSLRARSSSNTSLLSSFVSTVDWQLLGQLRYISINARPADIALLLLGVKANRLEVIRLISEQGYDLLSWKPVFESLSRTSLSRLQLIELCVFKGLHSALKESLQEFAHVKLLQPHQL